MDMLICSSRIPTKFVFIYLNRFSNFFVVVTRRYLPFDHVVSFCMEYCFAFHDVVKANVIAETTLESL